MLNENLKILMVEFDIDVKELSKKTGVKARHDEFFPTFSMDTILIVDPSIAPSHKSYCIVFSDKGSANLRQVFFDNEKIYVNLW